MGRGKVKLRRIENKINRQVTFSKRSGGLVKKTHEISVLCDAEVALIIFSHNAKLFEFSSHSCPIQENWNLEYSKLKAKIELLHRNHNHYMGEDLESLSLKDLQNLEQQLHTSLKLVRSRRNQLMRESISELHKKKKAIQEENNMLAKKIKDKENTIRQQAEWQDQDQVSSFLFQQQVPLLNIGSNYYQGGEVEAMRRNEHDLNLDSLYPTLLRCLAS